MNVLLSFMLALTVSGMISSDQKELVKPPKTNQLLFYIQRNHNGNTIVYDANFDKQGNLIEKEPVDVYWIRYEEQGQRMELRSIEKLLAYGVKCKLKDLSEQKYNLRLVANKKKEFELIQKAPNKAVVVTKINGHLAVLDHMYIFADNSGIWPKVKYIELFGKALNSDEEVYEKVLN